MMPYSPMSTKPVTALRLYFASGATVSHAAGWHKLLSPALGPWLLHQAKDAGIEQAILHAVEGGFQPGGKLIFDNSDAPSHELPQCVELLGEEAALQAFLASHRAALEGVRAVLFRGEENSA
jgi:hypothetical protein